MCTELVWMVILTLFNSWCSWFSIVKQGERIKKQQMAAPRSWSCACLFSIDYEIRLEPHSEHFYLYFCLIFHFFGLRWVMLPYASLFLLTSNWNECNLDSKVIDSNHTMWNICRKLIFSPFCFIQDFSLPGKHTLQLHFMHGNYVNHLSCFCFLT